MGKTNTLLEVFNGKVATIAPLFTAVADLSGTVSKLNDTGNNFAIRMKNKASNVGKATAMVTLGRGAGKLFRKKDKKKKNDDSYYVSR